MHGTKYLLATIAAKLVYAYKAQIAEYQTLRTPLALGISCKAPTTLAELLADADKGKLVVSSEHSATAIYGISGNITFRIFHDYGHILYGKEFTTDDEVQLAHLQWLDIAKRIHPEWRELCWVVYLADTVAQSRYEAEHGEFPKDQRAFVAAVLHDHLTFRNM